jgi:cellulose synthase/poly-beta-1,6-N-acetylglucosamine synthase-like glycosyltransferase
LISIFVPALNEAESLPSTIDSVMFAVNANRLSEFEILIFNDGSTDNTAQVIRELEKKNARIRSVHFEKNKGWGIAFQEAVKIAKYPKLTLYPGDGMVQKETLRDMIANASKADFVCAYTVNRECRTKTRNFISSIYTKIYIWTFQIPLRYANSTPVYPVALLRTMSFGCRRYSFPSEVTVKVMRSNVTFLEMPGYHNPANMKSSALGWRNLFEVISTYLRLCLEIFILHRKQYAKHATRVLN